LQGKNVWIGAHGTAALGVAVGDNAIVADLLTQVIRMIL
jgi:acetyltransferase-like isoleucine patch superfamily enzyme